MNILIASSVFPPRVGGVEIVTELLASAFATFGHEVCILTETPSDAADTFPFRVLRNPGPRKTLNAMAWCDIYVHSCISLRTVWPLLMIRRPWAVITHTWLDLGWRGWIKQRLIAMSKSICVSEALAHSLRARSQVIPNPYRADVFCQANHLARNADLIFVGRLIHDKGVDVAIETLAILRQRALAPRLTIVGSGPSEQSLRRLARGLGVADQITFTGTLSPIEVAAQLNRHTIQLVPSRWQEPFGMVALEGIACGCVVVGSAGGGLRDAVGPCGILVPNDDAGALADAVETLLGNPEQLEAYQRAAPDHLRRHRLESIAAAYLGTFESLARPANSATGPSKTESALHDARRIGHRNLVPPTGPQEAVRNGADRVVAPSSGEPVNR